MYVYVPFAGYSIDDAWETLGKVITVTTWMTLSALYPGSEGYGIYHSIKGPGGGERCSNAQAIVNFKAAIAFFCDE